MWHSHFQLYQCLSTGLHILLLLRTILAIGVMEPRALVPYSNVRCAGYTFVQTYKTYIEGRTNLTLNRLSSSTWPLLNKYRCQSFSLSRAPSFLSSSLFLSLPWLPCPATSFLYSSLVSSIPVSFWHSQDSGYEQLPGLKCPSHTAAALQCRFSYSACFPFHNVATVWY